ncbi:squalene synthase HpnC [Luteitalea sp. TBR-22]|uniref:squalene synthase HpnC n=1 Tax=Luteitalea sp. TBR-22 TaxID=2802971 RepID=UPI001AF2C4EF|nr:squalene synthase HpnC [Luteitalea sp. TBR-22]BCS35777.1 squalene synthase HpnC [Luteitalea sp. TBR-22]
MTIPDAYARCQAVAAGHYENFPVASRLLPAAMRPHVAAVYAFARAADDFADEGSATPEQRLAWIDTWLSLRRAGPAGAAMAPAVGHVAADDVRATFLATQDTIERCRLDPQLLDDLLSAFAQDVTRARYANWPEVLDYCRRSANPVGRLVLGIAGVHDEATALRSDAVCTALQLANFWQDLGQDWRERNRLYVPLDLMATHGATTGALDADRADPPWQQVITELGARTQALFDEGRPVCDAVRGRLRYELRVTWLGGTTVLRRTLEARRSSLHARPVLTKVDMIRILAGAVLW